MKKCKDSYKCPYGNAFQEGYCAYNENLKDYDLCPYLLENWEEIIDKMQKEEIENYLKF